MRTAAQIADDFYKALKGSDLARRLSGKVYHSGLRPVGSRKEDAVVVFTSGQAGQIDEGTVTVIIYVPDICIDGSKTLVANRRRATEVEIAALDWVRGLQKTLTDYEIELSQSIDTYADEDTEQHFVSVRIGYRSFDEDN